MSRRNIIQLEEGLKSIEKGMSKLNNVITKPRIDGNSNELSREYMLLSKIIYDMANQPSPHNYSLQLYNKHTQILENYITSEVVPSLRDKAEEFLLKEVVKQWDSYKFMVFHLSSLFSSLGLFIKYGRLPTLKEVGQLCFRDLVSRDFLGGSVRDAMIVQINRERGGEKIDDHALLKNVVGIYLEFGLDYYKNSLESAMLEGTACYYSRMAASWICEYSCLEYMLKAEECLNLETEKIALYYLHPSSGKRLLEKAEKEILAKYESRILEGCPPLLRDDRIGDLSRMFRLLYRIDISLKQMSQIFRRHIASQGMSSVKHAEQELLEAENATNKNAMVAAAQEKFVRNVIGLYDKYFQYVKNVFMNSTSLRQSLIEGFEDFCNEMVAGSCIGELFITFCDIVLRNRNLGYEDVEDILEKVVKILAFISDKDMIAEFYKKRLANRLLYLSHKSENVMREKIMLSKLKNEFGVSFTYRLESMLIDFTSSRNTQLSFDQILKDNSANPHLGIGLSVKVLTAGIWPTYNSLDTLVCPVEMTRCVEVFEGFYKTEKVDRRLKWIYSQGSCEMIGRFDSHEIEITATPWQACALLLFNDSERLAYLDVKSQLNLTDKDTVRLLQSLASSKCKILNKVPDTQTVTETDYFEFNAKISISKKVRKIRVPVPAGQVKENAAEDVEESRSLQVEASIVKIMKSKKLLPHSDLVMQCIEQLKHVFIPDIKTIKKRLEDLISKDYLERDRENPNIYRYIA